ncbi:hypothetical protein QBC40DRAFT_315670 [Triangularia verruculosa]|uniref:CFEM domain-containing protein n=1 Tax=Triangularia verruculosa TaxID=2587418 RepID=A0AAN7ANS2_9PEZI|nr:hypothetical protein QBC40DRAFT_315670 [Triangularia verruculosa]
MMVFSKPTAALLLAAATSTLALVPTPVVQHDARSEITPSPSCGEFPCGPELAAIPSCAVPCIESAGLGLGCATTDYGCHCDNLDALQGAAVNCVIDGCGGFDNAIPVVYSAVAMCQCVASNTPLPTPCPATTSTTTTEEPVITEPPCGDFPCSAELEAIPKCAIPCIENSGEKFGCGNTDYGCHCQNLDAIQGDAVMCVIDACGGFDNAVPVVYSAVAMCQCVASNTPLPTACPITSTVETTSTTGTSTVETSDVESSTVEASTVETSTIETSAVEISTTSPSPSETETTSDCPEESTTWDISTPLPSASITKPPTVTTTTQITCHTPCADQASAIPACATGCIESAGGAVGCERGDYNCQCASSNAIQATAVNCVLGACGGIPGAVKVVDSVAAMCGCVSASGLTSCETTTKTITVGDGDDDGPVATITSGGSQPGSEFLSVTRTSGGGSGGPVETTEPGDGGGGGGGGGGGDGSDGGDDGAVPGDDDEPQGTTPTGPQPPVVTAAASSNTVFGVATGFVGFLMMLAAAV